MNVLGMELPGWALALISWGIFLLATFLALIFAPSDVWHLPRDNSKQDIGALTSAQCGSPGDQALIQLGMLLTKDRKDQCEAPHYDSLIVEPQNTWSNYIYLLAGLLILFSNPGRPRLLGYAVGFNFCMIGITSSLYHASLHTWPQAFDVSWIYVLLISAIIYAVQAVLIRYWKYYFPQWAVTWLLVVLPIVIGLVMVVLKATKTWYPDSDIVTIALIVILAIPVALIFLDRVLPQTPIIGPLFGWLRDILSSTDFYGREWLGVGERIRFLVYICIPAGLSFFLRLSDGCGKPLCNPHGIQPHAFWHILSAIALWWVYDFLCQATSRFPSTMVWVGPEPTVN